MFSYRLLFKPAIAFLFSTIWVLAACSGNRVDLAPSWRIYVDTRPFSTVAEASKAEQHIDWSGDQYKKMAACTHSYAAKELHTFLKKVCRCEDQDSAFMLVSLSTPLTENAIVLTDLQTGQGNRDLERIIQDQQLAVKLDSKESFAIVPEKKRLYIIGAERTGTLYGVYHLLEMFGIRWYGPEPFEEVIPAHKIPHITKIIIQKPAFETRGFWAWEDRGSRNFYLWMARNRMNFWTIAEPDRSFLKKLGMRLTVGGHQHFHDFLNPRAEYPYNHPAFQGDENKKSDPYRYSKKEYKGDKDNNGILTFFEAHPEWYGLIDGERRTFKYEFGTNICTSNSDAVSELTKRMVDQLAEGKWRQANSLNFWPIDGGDWCQCAHCEPLGSPTDRLLILVHQVNQAIEDARDSGQINRDIQVIFPIYHETLPPPTRPLPAEFNYEKCIGTIFPIKRCYVHFLNDTLCTEYNTRIWNDFLGWTEQQPKYYKGQFFVGEYFNVSRIKSLPVLYQNIMAHDIPLYYRYGIRHAHYMHAYTSLLGMKRLNNYLFARLLWNPEQNMDKVMQKYYHDLYGAVAEDMQQLYRNMEYAMSSVKQWRHTDHLAQRIIEDKKPLFHLQHLKLKEYHPLQNDGVDLEESFKALQQCRKIIDSVMQLDHPEAMEQRLAEDDQNLRYAENTVSFYYWFAQAIEAKRHGDMENARSHFKRTIPYARGLESEKEIVQTASSHANAADGLEATRVEAVYKQFGKELLRDEWNR